MQQDAKEGQESAAVIKSGDVDTRHVCAAWVAVSGDPM